MSSTLKQALEAAVAEGAAEPRSIDGPSVRIVLAHHDPYLAFLIRQQVPEAQLIEAGGRDLSEALRCNPHLVIVLGTGTPHQLDGSSALIRVLDPDEADPNVDGERVLYRPLLPAEVERVVRRSLGSPAPESGSDILAKARSLMAPARLLAVLLSLLLETRAATVPGEHHEFVVAAIAYSAVRAFLRIGGRFGASADTIFAAAIISMTGGVTSSFGPLAFTLVIAAGMEVRSWRGSFTGAVVAVGAAWDLFARSTDHTPVRVVEAASWMLLFCLGGLAAGLLSGMTREREGLQLLSEANRVLSTLYRFARTMPGSLDQGSIAAAAMIEVRDRLGAPSGVFLVDEFGNPAVAGEFGCGPTEKLVARHESSRLRALAEGGARRLSPRDLPPAVVQVLGAHECFLIAPVQREGRTIAVILSSCVRHHVHARNLIFMRELAEEAAVAMENARLFSRVRDMSADQERLRLGRELHDGVIQALTHVRIELDLLGRNPRDGEQEQEIKRLSRVVQRAANDVRQMIFGLRSPVAARGLPGALRAYLNDLRSPRGPEISFYTAGDFRADPDTEIEVFRIAQEAVSNALRHARAKQVKVVLCIGDDELELIVEDDGLGFEATEGDGVGLVTMQERAERIGGTLVVTRLAGGGTKVTLTCPVRQEEVA